MSRTIRRKLRKHIRDIYGKLEFWYMNRAVHTTSTRRAEAASVADMLEAGFRPSGRDCVRGNPGSNKHLPSDRDSVDVAALSELDGGKHPQHISGKVRRMEARVVEYQIRGCPDCPWFHRDAGGERFWWMRGSCQHPACMDGVKGRLIEKARYGRFSECCPLREVRQ